MDLRDDPLATRWSRAQIGVTYGPEATLDDVASFLGGEPPLEPGGDHREENSLSRRILGSISGRSTIVIVEHR